MKITSPDKTVIYSIENCIKSYRKFAQMKLRELDDTITLDQALLLILIQQNPQLTQQQLAIKLFKDNTSVTRIIQLLIQKKYLRKTSKVQDRREYDFHITKDGNELIHKISPVILSNREIALQGLSIRELNMLESILNKISTNCSQTL